MQNKNIVGLHKFIKEMKRIVLVRHGQSQWNKENRFTGWTNVDLSPQVMKRRKMPENF
jgi:hypothetical protein